MVGKREKVIGQREKRKEDKGGRKKEGDREEEGGRE